MACNSTEELLIRLETVLENWKTKMVAHAGRETKTTKKKTYESETTHQKLEHDLTQKNPSGLENTVVKNRKGGKVSPKSNLVSG